MVRLFTLDKKNVKVRGEKSSKNSLFKDVAKVYILILKCYSKVNYNNVKSY